MLSAHTNTTTVGRLRIRSKSSDPQAEQQRMSRMLRAATLHPASLPYSALLIVRRLVDPLPSRLRTGPFDAMADSSWQRAVTSSLEKLAASAARPAYGFVPAESNAVLFLDRAEILAALALDWLSGTIASQWWWRELLWEHDTITALLHEWIESPQYVPGAVELLAQRKQVVQFIQRLPKPVVEEMLEAIIRAHAVPTLEQTMSRIGPGNRVEQPKIEDVALAGTVKPHGLPMDPAPWLQWVPEASTPVLSTPQKMLLIQSLMLRRAPTIVRTVWFQEALSPRQEKAEQPERNETVQAKEHPRKSLDALPQPEQIAPELLTKTREVTQAESRPGLADSQQIDELSQEYSEPAIVEQTGFTLNEQLNQFVSRNAQFGKEQRSVLAGQSAGVGTPLSPQSGGEQQTTDTITLPYTPLPNPDLVKPAQAAKLENSIKPVVQFETEYGGVFFLLGLALYLNIYSDFTLATEAGLELNIWDFLALMASEFTGRNVETDRLWTELAMLAGRAPSEPSGLAFDPPNEWQLPSDWLDPFPESYDHDRILMNGRLVLSHPAGFKVLDVPAGVMEENQPADRLQRWVGWMAAYLRARLVRALGREDAAEFLCRRRARVSLMLTHLDVIFSLDRHPIEIRMAGLDRNLGWIPAAGRYVAFHFE